MCFVLAEITIIKGYWVGVTSLTSEVFLRKAGTKCCNKPPNIVATCQHYSHPSITAVAVLKKLTFNILLLG